MLRNIHSRSDNRLVKCAGIVIVNSHDFASRFHFRTKRNINVLHLSEGKDRSFHCNVRFRLNKPGIKSQAFQSCFTESNASCNVHHFYICNFAQEWNCSTWTRINFDNINFSVSHNVLNVQQAFDVQRKGKSFCIICNGVNNFRRQSLRRINCDWIAAVNSCAFDVFHNSRNDDIDIITNCIDFNFSTLHISIYKNRMVRRNFNRAAHVIAQFFFIVNNFHCPAA